MIQVSGLTKLYENHLAVDGVSFSLPTGAICGLVGKNGAGKTTTMRCLAGLIPATEGSLSVAGIDVETDPIAVKRLLAYVPDDPPLFDDLTVGQHLDFIGRLYGVSDRSAKASQLLTRFDLMAKIDAGATTLSRGMRQKLAFCCASLIDPRVMLLDEPLTGLDPQGIRELLASITQWARGGTTVIISSHLLAMIQHVCTHVMVMHRGQCRFFGTTEQLRQTFPEAADLEQAYFAATSPAAAEAACP